MFSEYIASKALCCLALLLPLAGEGAGLVDAHPALIGQAADQARLIGGSIGGAPGQQGAEQGDGGAAKRPGSGRAQGTGH